MKTPNHQHFSESNLTIAPGRIVPVEPADDGPLRVKPWRQQRNDADGKSDENDMSPVEHEEPYGKDQVFPATGYRLSRSALSSQENKAKSTRTSKHRVRALTELIVELPDGGTREIVSESFLSIINGEGDIKSLRALTMKAARQLRTMYLSGGETALLADSRWKVKDFIWANFGLQLSIGPRGLYLGEGLGPDQLSAFMCIEANGHVWAGETYEDEHGHQLSLPLTTEDVLKRLSEKLILFLY